MQQQVLGEVLTKRRNRTIAIILGVKERECDQYLPPEASTKLRKVVLDQLNDFSDFCVDILNSLDNGQSVLNEEYLDKLDEMHELMVEIASRE